MRVEIALGRRQVGIYAVDAFDREERRPLAELVSEAIHLAVDEGHLHPRQLARITTRLMLD